MADATYTRRFIRHRSLKDSERNSSKSDAPDNYPCECPFPIVLLCTHAGGGYLNISRRTLVVERANTHTSALRASYSHILLLPLRCYHSSQPPLPPVNYSRSFFETFLWGELASASPAAGIGVLGVDRFLFELFEFVLALLVSSEARIGFSVLDSATLKLIRVSRVTSKLAVRLWSIFSRAIAGFFLRRTLLTGPAFTITAIGNETLVGPGESCNEGVLVVVDTSCSVFLSKASTAASKLNSWDVVEGHVESSTLSEGLLVRA